MNGDPVITPSTSGSVIVATSYVGTGPPSASLTPGVVFNSIWATGMVDSSSWDTGDPYAYVYTPSTSPISFNWQMANANGLSNGGSVFDGAAIEILPGGGGGSSSSGTLTAIAVAPKTPSIAAGVKQPFTAMGTYSGGTTQSLTNQATWTSTVTNVATISSAGVATGLCAGNTTISASLAGQASGTTLIVTGAGTTTTAVASSANPSSPSQSAQFTATVSSPCGTPSGTVQFSVDGSNYSSPVTLSNGTASVNDALASGSHSIVAAYSGSATFAASTSTALTQTVGSGNRTNPTLSVTNSPVSYNGSPQAAIVSASVSGTVTNVLYSGSSTVPSAPGTYAITASFTPSDTTDYNSLTNVSAGNFVIDEAGHGRHGHFR